MEINATPFIHHCMTLIHSNFIQPVLYKILERAVSDHIIAHFIYLLKTIFVMDIQPCCMSQIPSLALLIMVSMLVLDLAKVFDCVDHSILLKRLTCYGFSNSAHLSLRS